MGCNVSHGPTFPARLRPLLLQRFDEMKARRHHVCHPLKELTPSKKELLCPDDIDRNTDDDITAYQHLLPPSSPSKTQDHAMKPDAHPSKNHGNKDNDSIEENVVNDGGFKTQMKKEMEKEEDRVEAKAEDVFTDADDDHVEDDDDDDDAHDDDDDDSDINVNERKIGRGEDGALPGSPSFRVYFKDNESVDGLVGKGKDDASKKKPVSTKEGTPSKESSLEKKAKKGKKRRSFRKVLPKNLLGVKSCYNPSHHHSHTSSLDNSQIHAPKSTP